MARGAQGFPRGDRLRRSAEFRAAARCGRRAAGPSFVVVAAVSRRRDGRDRPRVGLTVSRRVGGAVVRNHVKRRVREWFRTYRGALPGGIDLVVIARQGAGELSGAEVARQLEPLAARAVGRAP